MPIVTVTVRKPKSNDFKSGVLAAIQTALVESGVSPHDRFHRVIELDEQDFQFDATFPDVRTSRTADFLLVEIVLGVGRTVKVKREILAGIVRGLSSQGFDPENVMVVFRDVPWENFSPAGGRILDA